MRPDRSNYEIWLTDWLDGSLDSDRTEKLMAFLEENPDIKEEADFLTAAHLQPGKEIFPGKGSLKRDISALTPGQVEFLSVASLEKDLDSFQESELNQCLSENPENKIIFDSIRRIKLIPSGEEYPDKKNLLKQTTTARIMRISFATLSAAATIAALILAYTVGPSLLHKNDAAAEQIVIPEKGLAAPMIVRTKIFYSPVADIPATGLQPETVINAAINAELTAETDLPFEKMPEYRLTKLPAVAYISSPPYTENSLIALNIPFSDESYFDDRNALTRFIAKNFREKILGDKTSGDAPVKPIEIAEAGVEGLNKLLGWEMTLVAVNDDAGELKSVNFDSKFLKFNAPVKKNEFAE